MAGHETRAVRPRTPQDKTKIAAGSPLAIQGIFLEILRERFSENGGLQWIWRPDSTLTTVIIETGYNEETEARNTVPAIFVNRLQSVPQKMVIGDRAGVRLPDHLEGFAALMQVGITITCIDADEGTSALLGDTVQFTLLAAQDVIQKEFGLHDFTHPTLGPTQPQAKDKDKWVTQVAFNIQFWIRWAQTPIAPLLQQVVQRVTAQKLNSDQYFIEVATTSMRRGSSNGGA